MLKLSRRSGETLVIQTEEGKVTIHFRLENGRAKLEIKAPRSVKIWRGEIAEGK
ncbi:MAG: carbon storage regulator [Porticoccus sp.]|nr:carbon storage regulator [Porticoccus sp.]